MQRIIHQKYNVQSLYSLTLIMWPKEGGVIFPTGTPGPGMILFAQVSKWCHQCMSRDISQLSCAVTSSISLIQHRTILACCAMSCNIATLCTISKQRVTLPSLVTSCFSCQPDLKQVIFSRFFMILNSHFGLCHWRLLVAIDRDCWCFGCRYQPYLRDWDGHLLTVEQQRK